MKQYLDRAILVAVLCVMAALGIWMQISLLEPVTTETVSGPGREPDYYIQNFTATGGARNDRNRIWAGTRT